MLLTDKGIDKVMVYQSDLTQASWCPTIRRSDAFTPARRHATWRSAAMAAFAYVNGEADMTLSTCTYDPATARWTSPGLSTVPEGEVRDAFTPPKSRSIPSGRVRVRLEPRPPLDRDLRHRPIHRSTLAAGHVSTGGQTPRNFAIHPSGARVYVANQDSDTIVQFAVDPRQDG